MASWISCLRRNEQNISKKLKVNETYSNSKATLILISMYPFQFVSFKFWLKNFVLLPFSSFKTNMIFRFINTVNISKVHLQKKKETYVFFTPWKQILMRTGKFIWKILAIFFVLPLLSYFQLLEHKVSPRKIKLKWNKSLWLLIKNCLWKPASKVCSFFPNVFINGNKIRILLFLENKRTRETMK